MFVLLFGLMGVAAIFPVGNHYAAKGDQLDRGAAMADAALAELKTRGLLRPQNWVYSGGTNPVTPVINNTNNSPTFGFFQLPLPTPANSNVPGPGYAFVIDPVGASDPNMTDNFFPFYAEGGGNAPEWSSATAPNFSLPGSAWPIRRVTFPLNARLAPNLWTRLPINVAETIMRLHDDVSVSLPTEDDRPGIQRWITADINPVTGNANNTPNDPSDDTPLTRAYAGHYSWLATVTPQSTAGLRAMQPNDPDYGNYSYDVAVAVFLKRQGEPSGATERTIWAELGPGGDLMLFSNSGTAVADVNDALEGIRAGQWIALAGVHPINGTFLLKWYKLLSLDDDTDDSGTQFYGNSYNAVRHAMITGPDWPQPTSGFTVRNLRALLVPDVIGVAAQTLKLETQ